MPTYNQKIMQYKLQLNLNNRRIMNLENNNKTNKLIINNCNKKLQNGGKSATKIESNDNEINNLKTKNHDLLLMKTRLKSEKYHRDKERDEIDYNSIISYYMDVDNEDSDINFSD
eukprot:Pgem_evm1s6940